MVGNAGLRVVLEESPHIEAFSLVLHNCHALLGGDAT